MTEAASVAFTSPVPGTTFAWIDHVPDELEGGTRYGPFLQTRAGEALFDYPHIGRFWVRDGCHIGIQVAPGSTREKAAAAARVAPFSAMLYQRGELALHSSSVVRTKNGRALLIAGVSGSGKSTTAAAFAQRGWKVLNDDVSRLTVSGSQVLVWPGFPRLKLLERSCELLNIDTSLLPVTESEDRKYLWSADAAEGAYGVAAIVELQRTGDSSAGPRRIYGSDAIRMLVGQTYRPKLVRALGCSDAHFRQVIEVADRVPCFAFKNSHAGVPDKVARQLQAVLE